MGWLLAQHASENIIQLTPECLGAAVGQGGGGSAICWSAVAYPNFSQNRSPKTIDYLSYLFFLFLAVAWGCGESFLCNSIALELKSAAKFWSRFQRLLVAFWGQLGVQFCVHFGYNFGDHFGVLV